VQFAPLFGHQYSHVWIDFRGIRDPYMRDAARGIDYFENSRRATLSQRAYATANPGGWRGYGPDAWGLTASDGPLDSTLTVDGRARTFHTYWARGAGTDELNDDGTIAPTAAGGSIAFAPEVVVPALRPCAAATATPLFGRYGFVDAFNPTLRDPAVPGCATAASSPAWGGSTPTTSASTRGRSCSCSRTSAPASCGGSMRGNPYIARGLCRAGFRGGWLDGRC
jgi:hypothetical protein